MELQLGMCVYAFIPIHVYCENDNVSPTFAVKVTEGLETNEMEVKRRIVR